MKFLGELCDYTSLACDSYNRTVNLLFATYTESFQRRCDLFRDSLRIHTIS